MPSDILTTRFLVLRKTPHLGANLIVSGISPDHGKMSFYIKPGSTAQGQGRSHSTLFDCFRLLNIQYTKGKNSDFCRCQDAELAADYTAISTDYQNFQSACFIAHFCLDNIMPEDEQHQVFTAAQVAFSRLADKSLFHHGVLSGFALVYLAESGWLDLDSLSPRELAQCQILIKMALGGDKPALTDDNWTRIWEWCKALLDKQNP